MPGNSGSPARIFRARLRRISSFTETTSYSLWRSSPIVRGLAIVPPGPAPRPHLPRAGVRYYRRLGRGKVKEHHWRGTPRGQPAAPLGRSRHAPTGRPTTRRGREPPRGAYPGRARAAATPRGERPRAGPEPPRERIGVGLSRVDVSIALSVPGCQRYGARPGRA